jgi:hypothetical protein
MFLIDDLVLGPAKFLLWIARQVDEAMTGECDAMRQEIIAELERLNATLEAGKISEDEFANRENILLDQLDHLEAQIQGGSNGNNPASANE